VDDRETHERLLNAATRLFADRGFSKVTVRDICRTARANVAAVNYHFGGKAGLYDAVIRSAIGIMRGTTEAARAAGEHQPPDQRLDAYVSIFLQRVAKARDSWIHQLMMRELSDPTHALDLVAEQVIKPRLDYLTGIIVALLGCDEEDPRVGRCLLSVNAQVLALLDHPVAARLRFGPAPAPDGIDELARHITCFSLAGIRAIATT
jgi:TetR/AcrR family transcriptional regulator, regulator of cefoperazone and chloramphenicol sensitivity